METWWSLAPEVSVKDHPELYQWPRSVARNAAPVTSRWMCRRAPAGSSREMSEATRPNVGAGRQHELAGGRAGLPDLDDHAPDGR